MKRVVFGIAILLSIMVFPLFAAVESPQSERSAQPVESRLLWLAIFQAEPGAQSDPLLSCEALWNPCARARCYCGDACLPCGATQLPGCTCTCNC